MTLRVAFTTYGAAKFATSRWHYSKSMPVPPHVIVGVWERDEFIGVVIFSRGAAPRLGERYGCSQTETCELTRVALRAHDAPVSQIVAEALRLLQHSNAGLRLCVSFADPNQGHHGGIYQAGNWFYFGQTSPSVAYFDSTGKQWHTRQVSATGVRKQFGVQRKVKRHDEMRAQRMPGKHRYLYPLDRAMRRKLAPHAQPYPCRRSVDGDTSDVLSEGAGSTPAVGSDLETR